jgi:hypothetical protein
MSRSDSYIDDSGEVVRRKATAGGGPPDYKIRDRRVVAQQMLDAAEEIQRRFPANCLIPYGKQQLRFLSVRESGRDATIKTVRYNVLGHNNLSGSPRVFAARATTFLKLVGDARPEGAHDIDIKERG